MNIDGLKLLRRGKRNMRTAKGPTVNSEPDNLRSYDLINIPPVVREGKGA